MESLRRPFLKKKLSNANNNSFSEKNAYDNVFAGGGPRFEAATYSARIDDYGEIFGGSRASSIPILDVSALDEPKVSADVRSSKLDYSKIFGGFGDCDLGVSYEEMFAKPKGARNFSVGARAPARKVSYSDGSDQLNHYREGATNFSVGTRAPARTVSYSDGSDQLNHYREGATNFSVGSRAPARTVSYSDGSDQLNHYREGATNFSVGGRAPARTVSYSDGSDQLNHSREGAFQNEVPNQSFEGVKQFNASYHKTSLRSDDGKHRTAHIAQLRSVPGFTCFIDENPPVQKKEDKSVPPPKVDVTSPPNVCANSTKKQTFDGMGKFESQSSWNKSHPIDRSFSANEPKTHSSKVSSLSSMPANLISSKSMPTRSMDSNSKVPKNDASKAGPGYCSPSFSDEELDENSAAAASAAALRKALETAQASIRIAKQFMERKKDVTQRFSKPSSKDGLDINDRREDKVTLADTRIREKNAKEMSERDDIVFQVFSKGEREKARRSGKVAPDLKATKEIPITKEVVREKNGNQLESAEACGAVKQVSGMENRGECRNATLPCDHDGGKNNITEFVDTHEWGMKDMETENEILEQPDGSGKKMDEEARKLEDLPVKLNILEATQDLEQHVGRLDTAQEVQEQEEKEKARVAQVDEETKENQKASIVQGYRENVLEEFLELKENEEFQSQGEKVNNNEEGLNEAQECMKAERKLEDTFGEEQNELLEEFFDLKENEEFESQGVKANSKEEGLAEAQDCMENERNLKDILGEEQNEKLLEEFFDLKENEEFECQGVKVNNSEEGHVEAQECMVDERKLEDICGEEQHDKLLEEFLDLKDNEEFDSQGVKANSNEEGPVEAQECLVNERKLEDISGEEKNEKLLDLKENVEFGTQEMKANDNEGGPFEAQECMENERKLEDIFGEEQNGKLLEEFLYLKENEEFDSQGVKADNYEEGHDEAQECMENERYPEDNFDIKQSEKLKDFHDEESGNGLRNICELNKVEKGLEASGLWAGDEEAFEVESSEKSQHDACEGDDNEKSVDKIHEPDISNKRFSDTTDGEESPEKQEGNSDFAGNENILVDECEETESIQRETEGSETTEVNQEAVEETMNLDATINACEWEEGENVNESEEVHRHKQNDYDLHFEENERISDATQSSWEFTSDENGLEAAEMAHELGGKESCNSGGLVGDAAEHVEMENTMKDGSEALYFNDNPANTDITDTSFGAKQAYRNEKESESTSTVGSGIKVSVCDSAVEGEKEADEEVVFAQEEVKNNIDTVHVRRARKQWFETGKKMEPSQPPSVFEGEEKTIRIDEKIKTNQIVDEVVKSNLDTAHERRARKQWFETGKKTEPSQPPIYKGEEKTVRIDEEIKTNQFTEKNVDNLAKTPAVEEKETKETEQKEVKKDYLRKIDEAYKRERERERDRMAVERAEREKDRMAVERAIREARERAFAEARERAERAAVERATAEARKRVMAEAREKLEKASAATKSSAEKASMEAKLRAERAAVERATVEARERALEKALSQKATSGARELSDRYVVEKVSGVSRESGTRQSFSSSDIQKLNEHNGESAERRKARLERNQRTMERAAKALAEKNRRDLLAQKEQAERNRYAETLDAEVKRWSSGKEGNLRALLSTLQYILGTNSGWQPVSLTEIVTTTAVKKAYRKATLHVHPDKLQQRGATIQQKYVCEKVFDLLKAAWNKFNSEER